MLVVGYSSYVRRAANNYYMSLWIRYFNLDRVLIAAHKNSLQVCK